MYPSVGDFSYWELMAAVAPCGIFNFLILLNFECVVTSTWNCIKSTLYQLGRSIISLSNKQYVHFLICACWQKFFRGVRDKRVGRVWVGDAVSTCYSRIEGGHVRNDQKWTCISIFPDRFGNQVMDMSCRLWLEVHLPFCAGGMGFVNVMFAGTSKPCSRGKVDRKRSI